MAQIYDRTECALHGTKYCNMLNMQSCESCTVGQMKQDDVGGITRDLDVIESLMPEGGISDLFTTDECVLCRGEVKGKRSCYAVCDIGNAQPKHEKRNMIGMKVTARTGSLVPVQLSCCSDCRKRIRMLDYFAPALATGVGALSLILMSIRPIREALMSVTPALPFILFVALVAAAVIVGMVVRARLYNAYAKQTYLDVMQVPKLAEMKANGWFELNESKSGSSRLVFSKTRIKQGLYTGVIREGDPVEEDA